MHYINSHFTYLLTYLPCGCLCYCVTPVIRRFHSADVITQWSTVKWCHLSLWYNSIRIGGQWKLSGKRLFSTEV